MAHRLENISSRYIPLPVSCPAFLRKPNRTIYFVSISDKKLSSVKFTSIYGTIIEVNYVDSFKSRSCMWCDKQNFAIETDLPGIEYSQCDNDDVDWLNSSTFVADSNEKIWLPEAPSRITESRPNGFGVRSTDKLIRK